jgi:hypothetical protein
MSTDTVDNLWTIDAQVLTAIVRQTEIEGESFPDLEAINAALGLDDQQGYRSIRRLVDAGLVISDNGRRGGLGGTFAVSGVTERGLRHAGAWSEDATRLAEQVIAALAEAAENEPEPERRGRIPRESCVGVEHRLRALTCGDVLRTPPTSKYYNIWGLPSAKPAVVCTPTTARSASSSRVTAPA